MKNKPFLIIRRSGYYINYIQNLPGSMKAWMENNLTRTEISKTAGQYAQRSLDASMKACCITFKPASAAELCEAPAFDNSLRKSFGVVK